MNDSKPHRTPLDAKVVFPYLLAHTYEETAEHFKCSRGKVYELKKKNKSLFEKYERETKNPNDAVELPNPASVNPKSNPRVRKAPALSSKPKPSPHNVRGDGLTSPTAPTDLREQPDARLDGVKALLDGAAVHSPAKIQFDGVIRALACGYSVDPNDYLEVTVTDPRGKTLAVARSDYFPKPVRFPGSRFGRQPSSYSVKLHFVPPAFSTIKVVYVRLN